jgi:hypothetical protein
LSASYSRTTENSKFRKRVHPKWISYSFQLSRKKNSEAKYVGWRTETETLFPHCSFIWQTWKYAGKCITSVPWQVYFLVMDVDSKMILRLGALPGISWDIGKRSERRIY